MRYTDSPSAVSRKQTVQSHLVRKLRALATRVAAHVNVHERRVGHAANLLICFRRTMNLPLNNHPA